MNFWQDGFWGLSFWTDGFWQDDATPPTVSDDIDTRRFISNIGSMMNR